MSESFMGQWRLSKSFSKTIIYEKTLYVCDFEKGQEINLSSGIPLIRNIEYRHIYNGIPILGDILSVSVTGDEIVKIRECWHEIISEYIDKRKKVVGLEDSLGKATQKLAQKFNKKENLRFKLKDAQLCYYGFHDAGKKENLFVPAWHFIIEKDDKTYHQFVNAHNNQPINYEEDIKNARHKK